MKIASASVKVRCRTYIPTEICGAEFCSFEGLSDPREHVAIIYGSSDFLANSAPLVRIHSECLTGDVFLSRKCDCGAQLKESQERLGKEGGIILYLRQEGRDIGLYNKLEAYELQNRGLDTFAANRALHFPDDCRTYAVAAQMLKALGVGRVRLITNNSDKVCSLQNHGIEVREVLSTKTHVNSDNLRYLNAKFHIYNHTLELKQ